MRLGLIARADNSGLGIQTHEFYKAMKPDKTMVVDISHLNGNQIYPERYPERAVFVKGIPLPRDIDQFLDDLDVVFLAEAPYNYWLYERAKERGVKVANQYNYEFFDWFANPHYPTPDMLIAPSKWNFDVVDSFAKERGIQHVYLHCPVNRDELPFREIKQARTFLHIAGRAAAHDRNGTKTVIEASKHLKTEAVIKIHFQGEQGLGHQATHTFDDYFAFLNSHGGNNIIMQQHEYDNYADVYKSGDVLILPRRYGGNCLPLNEALSTGMPVIMTNISPNDSLLPEEWLIPAQKIGEFTPRTKVDIYGSDPEHLARRIDKFYMDDSFISQNVWANNLAQRISWENLRPQYIKVLEGLCGERTL